MDPEGNLTLEAAWHPDDLIGHSENVVWAGYAAFRRRITLRPGQGRVGRTWQTSQPIWEPRRPPGEENGERTYAGLPAGSFFAVPIRSGEEVSAVLDFFIPDLPMADERSKIEMISAVASQIGAEHPFEGRRTIAELRLAS